MRGTAALKSIEALYKEAETVIGDGVPMVAIVKSEPPLAKPDIPVAKRTAAIPENNGADNADTNPDYSLKAEIPVAKHKAEAHLAVFDRIEILRSMAAILEDDENSAAPDNNDPAPISVAPEHLSDEPIASTAVPLPDAPPVPAYQSGTRQISDADLEDIVKRAFADIVAFTPLESVVAGNDRIESVMADIAEAVGKAAPAAISDNANAPDLSGASKAPLETAAQINLDDLNDSVARTVKSVIREELSSLVQSTVRTTLAELRATHDDKAESHLDDRPSGRPSE